jgi:hypothetical protein
MQNQVAKYSLTISSDKIATYVDLGAQMFNGFFEDFPGSINTTAPHLYTVENRTGLFGGGSGMYHQWGEWPSALQTEMPENYASNWTGHSSDSSGYGIGDVVDLASAYFTVMNANLTDAIGACVSEANAKRFADFVESQTTLFMGYGGEDSGYIPPYGDANW